MADIESLFERYAGTLSLSQLSKGIVLCIENALDLFGDAALLQHAGRMPRALSLLLAAWQEVGKVKVLRMMVLTPETEKARWKDLWKEFVSHRDKDASAQSMRLGTEHAAKPAEAFWQRLCYDAAKLPSAREKVRQLGLYVDYAPRDRDWWSPRQVTNEMVEQLMAEVVQVLFVLYKNKEMGLFSERALAVYKEEFVSFTPNIELGKAYGEDEFGQLLVGAKGPLANYWRRLVDEGVVEDVPDDLYIMGKHWKDFVRGGQGQDEQLEDAP